VLCWGEMAGRKTSPGSNFRHAGSALYSEQYGNGKQLKLAGLPVVLNVPNFLSNAEHRYFLETSKLVDHGYFGFHRDYRELPARSGMCDAKQRLVFDAFNLVAERVEEVCKAFCPGDQLLLRSRIKPHYLTYGVGTTLQLLHIQGEQRVGARAQHHHFDRKNIRDSYCIVLCVGDFQQCFVEFRDYGVLLKTMPGGLYIFPGHGTLHRVGIPRGLPDFSTPETLGPEQMCSRYSWIVFCHGSMLCPSKRQQTGDVPPWLKGRDNFNLEKVSAEVRWDTLMGAQIADPSPKIYTNKEAASGHYQSADRR